mmetsp:Transcript_5861/g.8714  ORF Transcript_5861/g.8714 Transcript_5861/m.8714 type:complete len:174 (-) Transcript_5861:1234-1755(-)
MNFIHRLSVSIPRSRPCATQLRKAAALTPAGARTNARTFSSESITYSGGQPSQGQGGYYGSGGARVLKPSAIGDVTEEQRSKMIALATDVEKIIMVMDELEVLESLMEKDQEENNGEVTNRSIELRGAIKHLITNHEFLECLDQLEIMGKPVWGLSSSEHELVLLAREKVNTC